MFLFDLNYNWALWFLTISWVYIITLSNPRLWHHDVSPGSVTPTIIIIIIVTGRKWEIVITGQPLHRSLPRVPASYFVSFWDRSTLWFSKRASKVLIMHKYLMRFRVFNMLPMLNIEGPRSFKKGEWNPLSPRPTQVRSSPMQLRPNATNPCHLTISHLKYLHVYRKALPALLPGLSKLFWYLLACNNIWSDAFWHLLSSDLHCVCPLLFSQWWLMF